MFDKRSIRSEVKQSKHSYKLLLELLKIDLQEQIDSLCSNRNPDDKTHLQGQIFRIKEYINLLT